MKVIINTHYLREQVINFINSRKKQDIKIKEFHEKVLLGAGTFSWQI